MSDAPDTKDTWDKLMAIATILVPAAIALAGYFIANGLEQAQIESEERRSQAEIDSQERLAETQLESEERRAAEARLVAEANQKVSQAALIETLIASLTSEDTQERTLAVEAVLIALPNEGPALVRIIAASDEDEAVQAAAEASLNTREAELILELFSLESQVRITASRELIQGWGNEPDVVAALVAAATASMDNLEGVFNTIVVLNGFSLEALQPHKQQLLAFIDAAAANGEKTSRQASTLEERLAA